MCLSVNRNEITLFVTDSYTVNESNENPKCPRKRCTDVIYGKTRTHFSLLSMGMLEFSSYLHARPPGRKKNINSKPSILCIYNSLDS